MIVTPLSRSRTHHLPHVVAQLDVDPGSRLVEKQDGRFVRQGLGDQDPALHAAGQGHDLRAALVPQRQVAQYLFQVCRIRCLPEQAAAEADGAPDAFERIGMQFLRNQADLRAGRAIVANDVVAVGDDCSCARRDDAADDVDQGRLARTVGTEQREDFAAPDLQVYLLECDRTAGVGLADPGDGYNCLSGRILFRCQLHGFLFCSVAKRLAFESATFLPQKRPHGRRP
jgi:hypothetical protein